MKTFVALALAFLLAITSPLAQASWSRPTPEDMVKWAGCSATLVTLPDSMPIESYYIPGLHQIHFGTKLDRGMTQEMSDAILMHETAHCLQYQKGVNPADYDWDKKNLELEADYIGAGLQCSVLHRDGAGANHDLFVWAHDALGYDGDAGHGSLAQRIHMGYTNPACGQPAVQGR